MTKGVIRYFNLWKHISTPFEYILNRGKRHKRSLIFTTKPYPIRFQVPASLYLVFKELFMADVYKIDKLAKSLPSNPVIVDVGANAGFFIIQLLSKIEKGMVYAYEPIQANVDTFRSAVRENYKLQQCVQLFPLAVTGEATSCLELFAEEDVKTQVVASRFADFDQNNTHKLIVPCISLGEIIEQNNLDRIDLLKLDCEGSEYDIIYNTSPGLLQRVHRMWIEVHNVDQENNNIESIEPYLQSLGYTTKKDQINYFCYALEAVRGNTKN